MFSDAPLFNDDVCNNVKRMSMPISMFKRWLGSQQLDINQTIIKATGLGSKLYVYESNLALLFFSIQFKFIHHEYNITYI